MDDFTSPLLPNPTTRRFRGFNLHHVFEYAYRNVRDLLVTMDCAVLLAFVASIGSLLQGWDNASIAGAMFYIKEEFNLQSTPNMEGLIMASALFGATITTMFSGAFADAFGRWRMLLASAVSSFISDLSVIFLSQHVYMLLFTRTIKGLSIGLAVTHVPLYIAEVAPSDMRGKLNTFPQLSGSVGMFLSYCIVFWMSLTPKVEWRIMLGIQSITSLIYIVLIIFYLPESPSWLVSQGKVDEAERVQQRLRRTKDILGEKAIPFDGTDIDHAPCLNEYLIGPDDESINDKLVLNKEAFKLYEIQEKFPCATYPVKGQRTHDNVVLHSSESTKWTNILEPGVKRALIVGIGIQVLQQFAGINGILYYMPQILEQAGVGFLLSKIGLSSSSVSILISALTTLLMLPFIGIAMSLMDHSGRRRLLLVTIPILLVSLIVLVIVNIVNLSSELHAVLSTISVSIYFCFFVMGFGPIPNILCAEIFPARARANCLTICSLTFWICDIIITYTLPVLMRSIGLAGVFGIFAVVCILALLFVYLKVLETKGIPLEDIADIYAIE